MKTKLILTAVCVFLCGVPWGRSACAGEALIAVAANFTEPMRALTPLFAQQTGHTVQASFGSTGKLYAQITHGAPFAVFLAADATRPARAEEEGWAVPGSRFTYATGQLTLWSAQENLFVDGEAYLQALPCPRLAIANPRTAPYGLAAQQVMEHLGVWEHLNDRLVQGESIAQTFQFVATENAESGFVARSQILGWPDGPGSRWDVPQSYHTPITQQAVLLNRGKDNEAARAFMSFLASEAAREIIIAHGYSVSSGVE